jgi:nitric oxide reductase NorQ protein
VPAGSPAGPPGRRLGSGELRAMVLAHLTEHLGQSFTPGELAHALGGRSTGAIGNALATLVERGRVTCTHTRPRRFAATAGLPAGTTGSPPTSAPARRPARPSKEPSGPVTRPNGQRYHPRALADHADVAALRALRAAGMPALLYGPPVGPARPPWSRRPSPTWSPWPATATPAWPTSSVIFSRAEVRPVDQQRCVADGVLDAA